MSAPFTLSAKSKACQFLSMEHVDGEGLGSLLRHIGRVPADKSLEIARKPATPHRCAQYRSRDCTTKPFSLVVNRILRNSEILTGASDT